MAKQPVGKPLGQVEPLPPEGQVGDPIFGPCGASGSQNLKAAVQQERMNLQPVLADSVRQGHLAQRLPWPGPELSQRAKARTEVDSDLRLRAVVGGNVRRVETGLQLLDIQRRGVRLRSRAGTCRNPAFRVQRPVVVGPPLAQNPDSARCVLVVSQQHLQATALLFASVRAIVLRKDERAAHLEVLDKRRTGRDGDGGRRRDGAIERAGRYQPVEHAVIAEPCRFRGEQLGVETDLATCRVVPRAQQRVPGLGTAPFGGLNPVALTLEGIAGQRSAAPLLTGKEPVEAQGQPSFVGTRDRFHEAPSRPR